MVYGAGSRRSGAELRSEAELLLRMVAGTLVGLYICGVGGDVRGHAEDDGADVTLMKVGDWEVALEMTLHIGIGCALDDGEIA